MSLRAISETTQANVILYKEYGPGLLILLKYTSSKTKKHITVANWLDSVDRTLQAETGSPSFVRVSDIGSGKLKSFSIREHAHDPLFSEIYAVDLPKRGQHFRPRAGVKVWNAPSEADDHDDSDEIEEKGIYVLRLDNGNKNRPIPLCYVGKSNNIKRRIAQHRNGAGAACIAGEPFTRVAPITEGSTDDMESWERNEVLARMFESGIDNVRGWMYTLRTMPIDQKLSAFDQICERFDRCRRCGRGTHFVKDCRALSTDLWTCGMELRSAYNGPAEEGNAAGVATQQPTESERRIAVQSLLFTEN